MDSKQFCCGAYNGSEREAAENAHDLANEWLAEHPILCGADADAVRKHFHQCRHAVEVRTRNEQRYGIAFSLWFSIISTVVSLLFEFLGWINGEQRQAMLAGA